MVLPINLQNTNITGDLIVNGLNIKNEIDALDTSFTTGTIFVYFFGHDFLS